MSIRLPELLVIGAMKSGTTTLYHDLMSHPAIFLAQKEGNFLTRDITTQEYAKAFHKATAEQLCGDVSMRYSMLPDFPGVAERARRLLSASTKIVYIVREPVARAISHHYHFHSLTDSRRMSANIDECIFRYPRLIKNSCYAMQLEPWLNAWGSKAIHVIRFEDYIANRQEVFSNLCRFLKIPPPFEKIKLKGVKNASVGKPVLNRPLKWVQNSAVYQRVVRPCLSLSLRDHIRSKLCNQAPLPPAPPRPETVDQMLAIFRKDEKRLRSLLGRSEPYWDFDQVRSAFIFQANKQSSQLEVA